MQVRNETRYINGKPQLFKTFSWTEDLQILFEAHEFREDKWTTDPYGHGDIIEAIYSPQDIVNALKQFLSAIEKGYEEVCITISSQKTSKASFTLRIYKNKVQAFTSINMEVFDDSARKLAKIKRIIESNNS
jgi:hypothetical protein